MELKQEDPSLKDPKIGAPLFIDTPVSICIHLACCPA